MKSLIAVLALSLPACATTSNEPSLPPGPCHAEAGAALVGRAANAALGAEALRLTGARRLRWIRPGDVVTMDYSAERLNLHLDAEDKVERLACG
jgi:peptidase inhibitor I78 family protein